MKTTSHRAHSWRIAASFALLLQTSASCDQSSDAPKTAVLVRVDSDLREELTSIDVQILDERAQALGSSYSFDLVHNYKLPLSFSVTPPPAKMTGSFLVVARGKGMGGAVLVETKGLFSFAAGRKLGVSLELLQSCRGLLCAPLLTCDATLPEAPVCGPVAPLATHEADDGSFGDVVSVPVTGTGSMQTRDSGSPAVVNDAGGMDAVGSRDPSMPRDAGTSSTMDATQDSGASNPAQSGAEAGGPAADTGAGTPDASSPSGPVSASWDQANWDEALWQ
jgi:hypothetical protein